MSEPAPLQRLSTALADRYSIEREIGAGGMATVYLAQDVKHNRPVALKVLRPELAAVLGSDRFLAEITTTANLQHPHILPLFDSGESDGFLYYVMPYVEGETLRQLLDREHQLPIKEAVAIAEAVGSALDYAHRHDVIHRDIKPENILLHDGNPVVADFGIALAVSAAGGGRMTETGLSLGTPHYMSPEQATADRDLSARSDVYSLACVLYEMLTGDPPHTGPTPQSILVRILTEEPRSVTSVRKSVPPNVTATITKGLEKLPADRFESAAEFGRALGDEAFRYVPAGQSTGGMAAASAQGLEGPAGGGPWLSDTRSRVAIVALLIAVVLLGLNFPFGADGAGSGRIGTSVTLFEVDLGDLLVPAEFTLSPDGSLLVFASHAPGEVPQLYMRRSDNVEVLPIPGTLNASSPVFSPDGDWIAFVVNGSELKRIPTQGGAALAITTLLPNIAAPAWGTDGSILFAGQQGLYRVPFSGGKASHILRTTLYSSHTPKPVPGGKWVLFTSQAINSSEPEVRILNLESGDVQPLTTGRDARYLATDQLIYATPGGSLVAAPFDPGRGLITGAAVPIIDEVAVGPDYGGTHFTLAESGAAVYAVGNSNQLDETLVMVDLRGNETPIPGLPAGNFSAPRFDPTGRYLAYELDGELWIRDLVLGRQNQLHEGPAFNPVWSADGSKIAFGYTPPSASTTQLLVRNSNLASSAEFLIESVNFLAPSGWVPDGSRLLYSEFANLDASGTEIWTATIGSPSTAEPYLQADGWNEGWGSFSPDGGWVAYESNEDGSNAVYARRFPEPGRKFRVSEGGGIGARWSADGHRIFYRNGDTTKVTNVRTDPTFEILTRETLFTGPYSGIDPNPDGTGVVAIRRAGAERGRDGGRHLYFVVNWVNGVEARLGTGR
jgi:eukaryotic-like serine/threonine-protein kinase